MRRRLAGLRGVIVPTALAWLPACALSGIAHASDDDNWWSGFDVPPAGEGLNDETLCFVDYQARLVTGGSFTQAGNNTTAHYIARFN
jgi:hypothetical protein